MLILINIQLNFIKVWDGFLIMLVPSYALLKILRQIG